MHYRVHSLLFYVRISVEEPSLEVVDEVALVVEDNLPAQDGGSESSLGPSKLQVQDQQPEDEHELQQQEPSEAGRSPNTVIPDEVQTMEPDNHQSVGSEDIAADHLDSAENFTIVSVRSEAFDPETGVQLKDVATEEQQMGADVEEAEPCLQPDTDSLSTEPPVAECSGSENLNNLGFELDHSEASVDPINHLSALVENELISDSESQVANRTSRFGNLAAIAVAPAVIAKKTFPIQAKVRKHGRPAKSAIIEAPKIVAKSTGGAPWKRKVGRPKRAPSAFQSTGGQIEVASDQRNLQDESANGGHQPQVAASFHQPVEVAPVVRRGRPKKSTQDVTVSILPVLDQADGGGLDQFDHPWPLDQNAILGGNLGSNFALPPPLPDPPEGNMTIYRGKWAKNRLSKRGKSPASKFKGIRRHHYSPYTITGKTFASTLATLAEPEGEYPCQQCTFVYNKLTSLEKHVSRSHNPNLRYKCPECPKRLSCKNAIEKHLLSHRPGTAPASNYETFLVIDHEH